KSPACVSTRLAAGAGMGCAEQERASGVLGGGQGGQAAAEKAGEAADALVDLLQIRLAVCEADGVAARAIDVEGLPAHICHLLLRHCLRQQKLGVKALGQSQPD